MQNHSCIKSSPGRQASWCAPRAVTLNLVRSPARIHLAQQLQQARRPWALLSGMMLAREVAPLIWTGGLGRCLRLGVQRAALHSGLVSAASRVGCADCTLGWGPARCSSACCEGHLVRGHSEELPSYSA